MFSLSQIKEILSKLNWWSKWKDSKFKNADTPLNGSEYLVCVQDGQNKKVKATDLSEEHGTCKLRVRCATIGWDTLQYIIDGNEFYPPVRYNPRPVGRPYPDWVYYFHDYETEYPYGTAVSIIIKCPGYKTYENLVNLFEDTDLLINLEEIDRNTLTIVPYPDDTVVTIDGQEATSATIPVGESAHWRVSGFEYIAKEGTWVARGQDETLYVSLDDEFITIDRQSVLVSSDAGTVTVTGRSNSLTLKVSVLGDLRLSKVKYVAAGEEFNSGGSITGVKDADGSYKYELTFSYPKNSKYFSKSSEVTVNTTSDIHRTCVIQQSKDTTEEVIATVSSDIVVLGNTAGQSGSVTVHSNGNWTISGTDAGYTVSPTAGSAGDTVVTVISTGVNESDKRVSLGQFSVVPGASVVNVYQEARSITSIDVTLKYLAVPTDGGTVSPILSYVVNYSDGTSLDDTEANASIQFSASNMIDGVVFDEKTGEVMMVSTDREDTIKICDVSVVVSVGGATGTATASVMQTGTESHVVPTKVEITAFSYDTDLPGDGSSHVFPTYSYVVYYSDGSSAAYDQSNPPSGSSIALLFKNINTVMPIDITYNTGEIESRENTKSTVDDISISAVPGSGGETIHSTNDTAVVTVGVHKTSAKVSDIELTVTATNYDISVSDVATAELYQGAYYGDMDEFTVKHAISGEDTIEWTFNFNGNSTTTMPLRILDNHSTLSKRHIFYTDPYPVYDGDELLRTIPKQSAILFQDAREEGEMKSFYLQIANQTLSMVTVNYTYDTGSGKVTETQTISKTKRETFELQSTLDYITVNITAFIDGVPAYFAGWISEVKQIINPGQTLEVAVVGGEAQLENTIHFEWHQRTSVAMGLTGLAVNWYVDNDTYTLASDISATLTDSYGNTYVMQLENGQTEGGSNLVPIRQLQGSLVSVVLNPDSDASFKYLVDITQGDTATIDTRI